MDRQEKSRDGRADGLLESSTTEGIPVSPSLGPALSATGVSPHLTVITARVLFVAALAVGLAGAASIAAKLLLLLIGFFTNLCFYLHFSASFANPSTVVLGKAVVVIPVMGALIVGLIARFGAAEVRGHGIPEAMEAVFVKGAKIAPRVMWLKPLSAAVSIGTGGPFGAEGPIIATGGALGSALGQLVTVTAAERATLLAAGAAAGMTAVFGSPVSATLLAIELLLFEYHPRSLIPVGVGATSAAIIRQAILGWRPIFAMVPITAFVTGPAVLFYAALGAAIGVLSTWVTRLVYRIEDCFGSLPIHWMWWPAIGAVPVGVIGYFAPMTMGVGYSVILSLVNGTLMPKEVALITALKLLSWSIALGSGTSGGTLAPLFIIGGGAGYLLGHLFGHTFALSSIDPGMSALIGMAAIFAGASRAVLASLVFALETTGQLSALLPLLAGCMAAYASSCYLMGESLMTEKIARRGLRSVSGFGADFLDRVSVRECMSANVVTLKADMPIGNLRQWIASGEQGTSHQGFPVIGARGELLGVVTRRDLINANSLSHGDNIRDLIKRPPIVISESAMLREAANLMVSYEVGRLPVISATAVKKLVGIVTRGDLLAAHKRRLDYENAAS